MAVTVTTVKTNLITTTTDHYSESVEVYGSIYSKSSKNPGSIEDSVSSDYYSGSYKESLSNEASGQNEGSANEGSVRGLSGSNEYYGSSHYDNYFYL